MLFLTDNCQELARKGAKLILVDHNEDALNKAVDELKAENRGLQVIGVKADVSRESDTATLNRLFF